MPVTVKNTNYGDTSPARRHHPAPAAPVATHPAPPAAPLKPAVIPTATKTAVIAEQKRADEAKAAADAAAAQAKAAAAPAAQPSGPIPSPFDVLGGGPAPETKAEVQANKDAAKEAAHGAAIDDDPEKGWVDDTSAKPN